MGVKIENLPTGTTYISLPSQTVYTSHTAAIHEQTAPTPLIVPDGTTAHIFGPEGDVLATITSEPAARQIPGMATVIDTEGVWPINGWEGRRLPFGANVSYDNLL